MSSRITAFYLEGCPYCRQAMRAAKELVSENPAYESVSIDWVEENQNPELSGQYDYYYVPSMFIGKEKLYEAHSGESYESCKSNVKHVLDSALV